MGKIDLNAMKRQREQQEATVVEEENELTAAYQSVWGSSGEKIEYIELGRLHDFSDNGKSQPFKLSRDKVEQIKLSAADLGIITPLIVRKHEGGYQIIAGHHRAVAAKELNILSVPCVVRNITDDEAYKLVVDSNIQRMKMLPSEYGEIFSLYMAKRNDIEMNAQEIADKFGISKKTMYRYINVSKLIPELQTYADNELVNIDCADTLSTFSEEDQQTVCTFLAENKDNLAVFTKLTSALVKTLAEIAEVANLTVETIAEALTKPEKPAFKNKVYRSVAVKHKITCSEKELDTLVETLLEEYFSKRK